LLRRVEFPRDLIIRCFLALQSLKIRIPDNFEDDSQILHGHEDIGILLLVLRRLNHTFFDIF
jgi:hypothetical protein